MLQVFVLFSVGFFFPVYCFLFYSEDYPNTSYVLTHSHFILDFIFTAHRDKSKAP